MFVYPNRNRVFSSFILYHRVCNKRNTKDATCEAGTAYPSGAPEITPVCRVVRVAQS